ncbi:MAG: hypothetical protein ACYTAN_11995 [Planctomycetota bacterium]
MSRRLIPLVAVTLVLSVALTAAAEEQWLQYRWSREPWRSGVSISSNEPEVLAEAPEKLSLPEFTAEDVRLSAWNTPMVEAGHVYLAVDRSDPAGPYDTLYIDSNCDGSLADESPVKAYAADGNSARFGPLKVVFSTPDGPVGHHVSVGSYTYPQYNKVRVTSAGWYEGKIEVGGKEYDCRLIDYNSNGTYDDTSMDFSEADRVMIGKGGNYDQFFAGKYVRISEDYYHPSPARDGAFIVLARAENVPLGTIKMSADVGELGIGGENGLLTLKVSGGAVTAPAGKWRISHWQMSRKDDQGAKWTMKGSGYGDGGLFDVAEGGEVTLDVGEPIVAALSVSKDGSVCNFRETLKGHQGESVSLEKNGQRPPAPRLRITNEDGAYNRLYSFEYG